MQKKYWIIPVSMTGILVASLLALGNPNNSVDSESKPTCCKKIIRECPLKSKQVKPVQTSLETLSSQFITIRQF